MKGLSVLKSGRHYLPGMSVCEEEYSLSTIGKDVQNFKLGNRNNEVYKDFCFQDSIAVSVEGHNLMYVADTLN